jgi:taurine dioxygenase
MVKSTIEIRPLSDVLGAEVLGANLSRDDDETFRTIHDAWLSHDGLVVIRDQKITPEQHIAFSRRFGPLIGRRNSVPDSVLLPGYPEILVLSNKKANGEAVGLENAGHYWHSDVTFEEKPAMGSLLYGIEVPPEGGDTLFANMYQAYETLPEETKQKIATLHGAHSYATSPDGYERGGKRAELTEEQKAGQRREIQHPVVRTHPETGRKALYVNSGFTKRIVEMDENDGKKLLAALFKHSIQEKLIYQHKWRLNDLLIWDNRCLIHLATPYDPKYTRHMLRTTVAGDRPY